MSVAGGDYFLTMALASPQESGPEPHDRRFDSIHLVVQPTPHFWGLADLDAKFTNINLLED